jgi:hypothetical protein
MGASPIPTEEERIAKDGFYVPDIGKIVISAANGKK